MVWLHCPRCHAKMQNLQVYCCCGWEDTSLKAEMDERGLTYEPQPELPTYSLLTSPRADNDYVQEPPAPAPAPDPEPGWRMKPHRYARSPMTIPGPTHCGVPGVPEYHLAISDDALFGVLAENDYEKAALGDPYGRVREWAA